MPTDGSCREHTGAHLQTTQRVSHDKSTQLRLERQAFYFFMVIYLGHYVHKLKKSSGSENGGTTDNELRNTRNTGTVGVGSSSSRRPATSSVVGRGGVSASNSRALLELNVGASKSRGVGGVDDDGDVAEESTDALLGGGVKLGVVVVEVGGGAVGRGDRSVSPSWPFSFSSLPSSWPLWSWLPRSLMSPERLPSTLSLSLFP